MKLTKEEVKELYLSCLELAKTQPCDFFALRKMNMTAGLCYWTDIELNPKEDIIPTAFHELVHYLKPKWSETAVKYAESRIINSCSMLELAEFLKHLADKLLERELKKLRAEDPQNDIQNNKNQ